MLVLVKLQKENLAKYNICGTPISMPLVNQYISPPRPVPLL